MENNEKNILLKKLGGGLMNVFVQPQSVELTIDDAIINAIENMPSELQNTVSLDLVSQISEASVSNMSGQQFIPNSGFKIPSATPTSGDAVEVLVQFSGENTASINDLVATIVPSPEAGGSMLGIVKLDASGDTSLLFSTAGAETASVNELTLNPNIEVSLVENNSKVLYTNKNSNNLPGIFELVAVKDSDKFKPEQLSAADWLELALDQGLKGDGALDFIQSITPSGIVLPPSECFDSI